MSLDDMSVIYIARTLLQGVDFFFGNRAHALKFIDFVGGAVPIRHRSDKQLVSHNEHAATYNYKYTFSVEIVPVCKVWSACRACACWVCFADGGVRGTGARLCVPPVGLEWSS